MANINDLFDQAIQQRQDAGTTAEVPNTTTTPTDSQSIWDKAIQMRKDAEAKAPITQPQQPQQPSSGVVIPRPETYNLGNLPGAKMENISPRAVQLAQAIKNKDYNQAPEGVSVDQFRRLLGDPSLVDQYLRLPLEAGLATAGEAIGARRGPGSAVAGAAMGNAAGRGIGNVLEDLENSWDGYVRANNLSSSDRVTQAAVGQAMDMFAAGKDDAVLNMGLRALPMGLGSMLKNLGKAAGLMDPAVKDAILQARSVGLSVGAIHMNTPFVDAANKVLLVLPIIGGPAREASRKVQLQIAERTASEMRDLAPSPVDLNRLSIGMSKKATAINRSRWAMANWLYMDMRNTYEKAGDPRVIPTKQVTETVNDLLGSNFHVTGADGKPVQSLGKSGISPPLTKALESWLNLKDSVKFSEYDAMLKDVNKAIRSKKGSTINADDYYAAQKVRDAINADLMNADLSGMPDLYRHALVNKVHVAAKAWAEYRGLEETAVASAVKGLSPDFFRAGAKKALDHNELDTLAQTVLNNPQIRQSPNFVSQVEELFGPDNRKALGRALLDRAADSSMMQIGIKRTTPKPIETDPTTGQRYFMNEKGQITKGEPPTFDPSVTPVKMIDAAKMRADLGLTAPDAANRKFSRATLDAFFSGTGVNAQKLDDILKVAERIQKTPAGDPSTFLQRRLIFAGVGMLAGAGGMLGIPSDVIGTNAGLPSRIITIGAIVMTGRAFSKLLSTPQGLNVLREGLDPNMNPLKYAMLAFRVNNALKNPKNSSQDKNEPVQGNVITRQFQSGSAFMDWLNGLAGGAQTIQDAVGKVMK